MTRQSASPSHHRTALKTLGALLLYILATAVLLFPLSLELADHVPDWGDPLENTWALAWGGRALLTNPLELYNANIFYPYPNSLAFSESQLASAVLGLPILLATNNPILAYNFVFFAAFVLSGFNMYLLAYDVTKQRGGALVAGFAFAFWAYKFNHISHINLVTLQWLPLVLLALRRSLTQDRLIFPILFAVTLILQALSSWYAALMTLLAVALYIVYELVVQRRKWNVRRWVTFAVCFALALAPIALIALPYFQVSRELDFSRSLQDAERFSARPLSFVSVSTFNWLYQDLLPKAVGEALFPGALVVLFAILGLGKKYAFADRAFWIFGILFFGLVAFGPIFQLTSTLEFPSPLYRLLYEVVPGFQGTRAPARFFVIGMLGLCLLAANGFRSLTSHLSPRISNALLVLALGVLAIEYAALPIRTVPIEANAQIPPVYAWLKQQPAGNVIELPILPGEIEPITRAMYFSIDHGRATPLGYASFIPTTQNDFLNTLNTALETPSSRVTNLLREFGVRYVIVNRTAEHADRLEQALLQLPEFVSEYEDATHRAYRLKAEAPEHPLQYRCVVPAYASPGAPYLGYFVIRHGRRYPIVNQSLQPLWLTLAWQSGTDTVLQTQTIPMPYVIREQGEGVPMRVNPPGAPGEYELTCTLGNDPSPLTTQTVRVTADAEPVEDAPILELLGTEITATVPQSGLDLLATFFWRRRAEMQDPVLMQIQVVGTDGNVVAEQVQQPIAYTYPVRVWRDNELVADRYALPIPGDAGAGSYRLVIRALDENTNEPIPFRDPDGGTTTEFSTDAFEIP